MARGLSGYFVLTTYIVDNANHLKVLKFKFEVRKITVLI